MAESAKTFLVISKLFSNIIKARKNINSSNSTQKIRIEDEQLLKDQTYTFLLEIDGKKYDYINLCEEDNILNFPQELMTQVLEVRRYGSSKTGYFPSGIITLFSQTFLGYAYRQEYIILKTTNFLIKICVPNEDLKNQDNEKYDKPKIQVQILNLYDKNGVLKDEQNLYKKLNENEIYTRVMGKLTQDEIKEDLYLDRIVTIIRFWRLINIQQTNMGSTSDAKSLARSLFYFCSKKAQIEVVLCSLISLYSDKPFYIGALVNLDGLLIEKGVLAAYKQIRSDDWNQFREIVEQIIDQKIISSIYGYLEVQE